MSDNRGIPNYLIYCGIFVVVFVVALGIFVYTANKKSQDFTLEAQKYQPVQQETETAAPQASAASDELKVTIASPDDKAVINTSSVKIAGASKPGTTVTITGGASDTVSETNTDGSFAIDVPLTDGENALSITVFDQAGQKKTINRTVFAVQEG